MITWMQRHKKWLVITIWISTIAFVGAGFVGWGSYKYGSSSGSIATVDDLKITMSDLQNEYNSIYTQYQNALGETFNQEMAEKFKLKEAAYKSVVQKFILLNYAKNLGLYITDKEVAKSLVQMQAFLKDGKFNKDIYLKVLNQNRTNPKDFEKQLKNDLLIGKLQTILNINLTSSEINNVNKLNSLQDKISINIIKLNDIKVQTTSDAIKAFWEQTKDNYKSLESYKIAISKVKISKDKKVSKKNALKKYLKLKKGELKFEQTINVDQNTQITIPKQLNKIAKPVEYNGEYIIVKLLAKNKSKVLPFSKVVNLVKNDYIRNQKKLLLQERVQKLTSNFKGKDIGFISKNKKLDIQDLNEDEEQQLITHVLNSQIIINSIFLEDKAIVYKIIDSKFLDNTDSNSATVSFLQRIKSNEAITNLLKQLENKYTIKSNMKVN